MSDDQTTPAAPVNGPTGTQPPLSGPVISANRDRGLFSMVIGGATVLVLLILLASQCSTGSATTFVPLSPNDAATTSTIAAASPDVGVSLAADPDAVSVALANFSRIDSTIADGVVTLMGEVDSLDQRAAAENAVRRLAGVTDVINLLTVPESTESEVAPPDVVANTVVDVLSATGDHMVLVGLLEDLGLIDDLAGDGPFTIFAPTDDAFENTDAAVIDGLFVDAETARRSLGFHVVFGERRSASLADGDRLGTLAGPTVGVTVTDTIRVADAEIVDADIVADNGVIHSVATVIIPPDIVADNPEELESFLGELEGITFETGSTAITAEGREVLDIAVQTIIAIDAPVTIEGHTDDQGGEETNQTLSEGRAQAVVDYLVSQGVNAALLTAVGYGESQPVADNTTPEGRAENRRIDFLVADR